MLIGLIQKVLNPKFLKDGLKEKEKEKEKKEKLAVGFDKGLKSFNTPACSHPLVACKNWPWSSLESLGCS